MGTFFCHKIKDNFLKIYNFNGCKYLPILTLRYLSFDLSYIEDTSSMIVKTSLGTFLHFKCYFHWRKFNYIEKRIFKITSFVFSILFFRWLYSFLFLNSQNRLPFIQSQSQDSRLCFLEVFWSKENKNY